MAVVATVSGTSVVSTLGGSSLYYSASPSVQYQYVQPSNVQYQYVQQPYVASSSAVVHNSVPVTYAAASYPSASYLGYSPYYSYGTYGYTGLLKK
jgi:hypothetical protein